MLISFDCYHVIFLSPLLLFVDGTPKRSAKLVKILRPLVDTDFEVGPALFGPDIGENEFQVSAELVEPKPLDGCSAYSDEEREELKGKIFLIVRGGCLFIQKVSRVVEYFQCCGLGVVLNLVTVVYILTI